MERASSALESKKVITIIPTYEEAETIEPLIRALEQLGCIDWILVIDDGSKDGTLQKLQTLGREYDNIFVHVREQKLGLGSALKNGVEIALQHFPFNRLIQMDGDLSHNPQTIPKMLKSTADVVIGSRYVHGGEIIGWNSKRKLISWGANLLVRFSLGLKIHDATSGFRVHNQRSAQIIAKEACCSSYEFQVETLWLAKKHQLTVQEVPITFMDRRSGRSKLIGFSEMKRLLTFLSKHISR